MFTKIRVLKSFYESELGKPFTEGTEDEMPAAKAKQYADAGLVSIVESAVQKSTIETADLPEDLIEKAVVRSKAKGAKK